MSVVKLAETIEVLVETQIHITFFTKNVSECIWWTWTRFASEAFVGYLWSMVQAIFPLI